MSENKKKTLGISIVSLVCGCLFVVPVVGLFTSPVALILGIVAVNKISKNKDTLKGKGMAIAGIVLGVLGVICYLITIFIVIPGLRQSANSAKISMAKADIQSNFTVGLQLFELDNGRYPTEKEGLEALTKNPLTVQNWNGPYLKRERLDPWGQKYVYRYPGVHNTGKFDLYSIGMDGQPNTKDDVVNW